MNTIRFVGLGVEIGPDDLRDYPIFRGTDLKGRSFLEFRRRLTEGQAIRLRIRNKTLAIARVPATAPAREPDIGVTKFRVSPYDVARFAYYLQTPLRCGDADIAFDVLPRQSSSWSGISLLNRQRHAADTAVALETIAAGLNRLTDLLTAVAERAYPT